MFDERAFLARIEAADVDAFAEMLLKPSSAEEDVLRSYFGEVQFQHLHSRALRRSIRSNTSLFPGSVVVLPDFLGCALVQRESETEITPLWPDISRLLTGNFDSLSWSETAQKTVQPGGILNQAYGELLLSLAVRRDVHAFCYDWREGISRSAAALDVWLGAQAFSRPVDLVAHGMGGLVARAFLAAFPARWQSLGGRLLMLGDAALRRVRRAANDGGLVVGRRRDCRA